MVSSIIIGTAHKIYTQNNKSVALLHATQEIEHYTIYKENYSHASSGMTTALSQHELSDKTKQPCYSSS
jgi:hypothetical protein